MLMPSATGWPYLDLPAFRVRAAVAAHLVGDCRHVVEIGGGQTAIDGFVAPSVVGVIVLDPFIADETIVNAHGARVHRVRARFQDVRWEIRRPGDFALVMLGLELLDMSEGNYRDLFALIDRARCTVLEFSSTFDTPREQLARIREGTATTETFTCRLDLRGNDVPPSPHSWPVHFQREVHVLTPLSRLAAEE